MESNRASLIRKTYQTLEFFHRKPQVPPVEFAALLDDVEEYVTATQRTNSTPGMNVHGCFDYRGVKSSEVTS